MNGEFYKPRPLYGKSSRPFNKRNIVPIRKIEQPKNDLLNFPELVKQPNEQPVKKTNDTKLWTEIVKTETTVQNTQIKQSLIPSKQKKIKKNISIDSDDDNSDDNDIIIKKTKPTKEINKVDEDGWNIVVNGIKKEDVKSIINDDNIKRKKHEDKNKIINSLIKNVVGY